MGWVVAAQEKVSKAFCESWSVFYIYSFKIWCLTVSESHIAHEIACRPVITDLKLDATYALIKEWLIECDDQHADCFNHLPPTKLSPTHLINVNALGHDQSTVVLEKIGLSDPFPKYAALSYIWGSTQPYMTTTRIYLSYQKGIPLASLGRCLQDAIWVTRKLNLSFLWIDALCIIQDSTSNKMQEIARMDSIYSFAYVTLSASHISSSTQSFLSTSPSKCIHRFSGIEVPFQSNGAKAQLRALDRKDDGYNNHWREDLEPIHSRAWAFQEHFMSPRILLFKDFQLFWICTKSRGRDGGWMAPDEVRSYGQQWNLSRRTLHSPMPEDWQDICQTYAKRRLTDPNDKLSALSSVASYFATTGSSSYAAGIWMTQYIDQLAWITTGGIAKRPDVWRAPSWSWASLDCRISFWTQKMKGIGRVTIPYLQPQIVTWRVEPVVGASRFGPLKSAFIQIRGRLLKSRPRKGKRGYELRSVEGYSRDTSELGTASLWFDLEPEEGSPLVLSTIQGIEPWDDFVYCLLLRVDIDEKLAGQLSENMVGIKEEKIEEIFCLALRQLPNREFYRVGRVLVYPREGGIGWLKAFEEAEETTITII